jgi:multidrug efflux pump subunit AcrA (membrane-fusion protein)
MVHSVTRNKFLRLGLVFLLLLSVLGGGVAFFWGGAHRVKADSSSWEGEEPEVEIPVKTVHPRYDREFVMTVQRPANVEAYYWNDIESRVPGEVKMIRTEIGDQVKAGEALIELDVPDLAQSVKEKEALVKQREKDYNLALANVKTAEVAVELAKNNVKLKKTTVLMAEATRWFREQYYERMSRLRGKKSIDQGVVDEAQRNYQAAVAEKQAAEVSVEKATLGVADAKAKLEAAKADVELKKALIEVAKSSVSYAKAMLEFATIRAPFDGVIVRRKIDPGSFVQNASNNRAATPLLSMERSDIVNVSMRLPDRYAAFITSETEAIVEVDSLPGLKIRGKVTRFAPSLVNNQHDLTMRVEVDLWNGTVKEFKEFMEREQKKKIPFDDLKKGPLPILPNFEGKLSSGRRARLLPGMYGKMTLVLQHFDNTYLIPSSAIVNQGGSTYVYVVVDGRAHLQPVRVQVDDGRLVKVELLGKDGEVVGDLTGAEEIVISGQGELSEGQLVKTTLVEDWKATPVKNKER